MGRVVVSEVTERFRCVTISWGSLTFIVSEVKERFSGSPQNITFWTLLSENGALIVGVKTPGLAPF